MTLTDANIRNRFVMAVRFEAEHRMAERFAADFDTWLSAHDEEVRGDERERMALMLDAMEQSTWKGTNLYLRAASVAIRSLLSTNEVTP